MMLLARNDAREKTHRERTLAQGVGEQPNQTHPWSGQRDGQADDERVPTVEDVRCCLQSSCYGPIQKLDCQIDDGVVVIRGTVPSFYLKQVAQELLRRLGAVQRIRNLATVEDKGKQVS